MTLFVGNLLELLFGEAGRVNATPMSESCQ